MRKNNLFNRIFHSKEVKKNIAREKELSERLLNIPQFYPKLKNVKDFEHLLEIHKEMWALGLRHNIGPDNCGYYRTSNIETMTLSQVFLGDILGLNTMSAEYWSHYPNEEYGPNGFGIDPHILIYDIMLDKYRAHLLANLHYMEHQTNNELTELRHNNY